MAEAEGSNIRERLINFKRDLEPFTKVENLSSRPRKSIFRVREKVRKERREQFEPEFVSLGLYNRSGHDSSAPKTKGDIFRWAIVGAFLADLGKTVDDWEDICGEVVRDPEAMLAQYAEEGLDKLSRGEVQSVLCFDAIFLACIWSISHQSNFSPEFRPEFSSVASVLARESASFIGSLYVDMHSYIENQIPLELIRNVLWLICTFVDDHEDGEDVNTRANSTADSLLQYFCNTYVDAHAFRLPGFPDNDSIDLEFDLSFKDECKHLLHCVYAGVMSVGSNRTKGNNTAPEPICAAPLISVESNWTEGNNTAGVMIVGSNWTKGNNTAPEPICAAPVISVESNWTEGNNTAPEPICASWYKATKSYICGSWHRATKSCLNQQDSRSETNSAPMESCTRCERKFFDSTVRTKLHLVLACQLKKAGINFHGHGGGLVAIFKKHLFGATLFLPKINLLDDRAEPLWRNLLAFEEEHECQHHFVAYLQLMDELIDVEEDVALLTRGREPIIANNFLGTDAHVAKFFNTITREHMVYYHPEWVTLRKEILEYYKNALRKTWVEFRTTNFGKPWFFISFFAAVLLLILTILQTVYAIVTFEYAF